ncbi:hypothetical protein BMR08_15385, partial [Methylococcaceae bacterium CS2]
KTNHPSEEVSYLAIGVGPSNLSLAALASKHDNLNITFLEKKKQFSWHEGSLLPFSNMQSSHIRDLVTLADPTNKFSFISYLHSTKKLYHFMAAEFSNIPRFEFNNYYKWAAEQLPGMHFDEWVNEVQYEEGNFRVHTSKRIILAKNLILGIGSIPYFPEHAVLDIDRHAYHGTEYCKKNKETFRNKKVVVVGGGQTGAEVFFDLFTNKTALPKELTWISRRSLFNPMEESPFHTEIFTPYFSECFYSLDLDSKEKLLAQHKLASDGVSSDILQNIYKELYFNKYQHKEKLPPNLLINTDVVKQELNGDSFKLYIQNKVTNSTDQLDADIIIYCTGLDYKLPEFLNPIKPMLTFEKSGIDTHKDFSAKLPSGIKNKIYIQNGSTSSWGVSDRNLVLGAWRSAKIINSMLGFNAYDMESENTFVTWK